MKTKKSFIILIAVVAIIAAGALISLFANWSVDRDGTSGDIAKSARFSRQTAAESLSNMEELILGDENYKNSVVVSYVVMQTRAEQFSTLVDMSNEAAGEIPAFAGVLGKMNEVREMAGNVCASLEAAGKSLEAILGGESRPEVGQQTNNAALAYLALQKQNNLATQFIDTTDKYLEANEGSDELKLVRDQWLAYQQMTASLEGDSKLEKKLAEKEALLQETAGSGVPTLGAMSYIHEQFHMLSIPLVLQSFDEYVMGLGPISTVIFERANVDDNVLGIGAGPISIYQNFVDVFGHEAGLTIQDIATGNIESLGHYVR